MADDSFPCPKHSLFDEVSYYMILKQVNETIDRMHGEIDTFVSLRDLYPNPSDCAKERHAILYAQFECLLALLRRIETYNKEHKMSVGEPFNAADLPF